MHAAVICAVAHVVLAVDPAEDLRERDGLRDGEAGLPVAQSRNAVAERDGGHAVVEGDIVGHVDAGSCGGIVGGVGEEVGGVAVGAVPVGVKDAGDAAIADRIAGLQRVRIRGALAAELGNEIDEVGSRVALVVIQVDALPQALILRTAATPAATAEATTAAGLRGVCAQTAVVADACIGGVRLPGGKQVIVVAVDGFAVGQRLREVRKQRRGLRGDRLVRNVSGWVGNLVGRELLAGHGIVDGGQSRGGEVAAPLGKCGHSRVKVVGIRRPRAGKRKEDRIFAAGLGEVRNIRRAHERKSEPVGTVGGLRLLLAEQSERLRIEVGSGAIPRDGAVGLRGIEAAEISSAAATAAAATASAEAATTTTKPAAAAKATTAEGSAESSAAAVSAKQAALAGKVATLAGAALAAGTALWSHASR